MLQILEDSGKILVIPVLCTILVIPVLRRSLETLTEHELVQHIRSATHVCGHILDVIITREDSLILFETPFVQDPNLCDIKGNPSGDHFALLTKINVSKPPKQRKTITYRKYRDIDISD